MNNLERLVDAKKSKRNMINVVQKNSDRHRWQLMDLVKVIEKDPNPTKVVPVNSISVHLSDFLQNCSLCSVYPLQIYCLRNYQMRQNVELMNHPMYSSDLATNDFFLILLIKTIDLTKIFISSRCLEVY